MSAPTSRYTVSPRQGALERAVCSGRSRLPRLLRRRFESGVLLIFASILGALAEALPEEDMHLLRAGDLAQLQHKYESSTAPLDRAQRGVLCEIYLRQVAVAQTEACLEALSQGANKREQAVISGKLALLYYLISDYKEAAHHARDLDSLGGRYVHALAQLRLGNPREARELASLYGRDYSPEKVFLAASLFFALGDCKDLLDTLRRPPLVMDLDYGLAGNVVFTGNKALAAPLRVDLFDEYQGYGLFGILSFAPPSNVYVEFMLGACEARTEDADEAMTRLQRILDYPGIDAYRGLKWQTVAERARLRLNAGDSAGALEDYIDAVDGFDEVRTSIATDAGRISFSGDKRDIYGELVRLLLERGDARRAFEYTERFRSRALVDLMASVHQFGPRGNLSAKEQAASIARAQAAEISMSALAVNITGAETSAQDHAMAGGQMRAYLNDREQALDRLDREVREYVEVPATRWSEVSEALGTQELLISYYHDGKQWRAFMLRPGNHLQVVDLGALPGLQQRVQQFRLRLESAKAPQDRVGEKDEAAQRDLEADAVYLYQVLIDPLLEALPMAALPPQLTIIPHGPLHYLPFAALKKGPQGDYLVQQPGLAIAYLPAARIRPFLHHGGEFADSMLIIADPARADAPRLDWARQELQLADGPDDEALAGHRATRERFREKAAKHGVLHLAAHGKFEAGNPIGSRILLAPNKHEGDLTTTYLFSIHPRWRARMVVLSACESAVNAESYGQELIGLQRGLLFAGAGSIVGSLWRIEDEGTFHFMRSFYRRLRSPGQTTPLALAASQRQLIEKRASASVWAAFTYTGIHE